MDIDDIIDEWVRKACGLKPSEEGGMLVYCDVDDPDAVKWEIPYMYGLESGRNWDKCSITASFDSKRELQFAIGMMRYAYEKGRQSKAKEIRNVINIGST